MFARPSITAALWDQRFDNHLPLTALPPVCLCIATWRNSLAQNYWVELEIERKTMSLCSDKRDILDLVKLSYIIVRTGIGTGQIQVTHKFFGEKNWPFQNLPKLRTLMVFELNQVLGQRYKLKPICKSLPKLLDFQKCDDASVKMPCLQSSFLKMFAPDFTSCRQHHLGDPAGQPAGEPSCRWDQVSSNFQYIENTSSAPNMYCMNSGNICIYNW